MSHLLSSHSEQIVQPEDLLARPNANRLFIDVHLGEPADELKSYREGHILGAVHAQIREVFAGPPTPDSGNLPLPDVAALQQQLQAWGVDADTELVLYGPSLALAARGWWVLRWAGLRNVKVLDSGLRGWVQQGGAVAQGDTVPPPRASASGLVLQPGQMPQIEVDAVAQLQPATVLIDARDEAAYLAGCIPRARHLPSAEQWTPAASLRTVAEVRQLYESVGVQPGADVVVYCGGGVLSALAVLTLEALGHRPRLFVGSWSQWNKCPRRMALSATFLSASSQEIAA